MPVYEYACMNCRTVVSVLVKRIGDDVEPACPKCDGADLRRLVSNFAFHLSLTSKLDQLDPKYDKMIDASNPDLAFDKLVQRYGLDKPIPKKKQ